LKHEGENNKTLEEVIMKNFIGFKLYAIFHEGEDLWFNVEEDGWVDELSGECLFPTYELAFDYMKENADEYSAKVYNVEIPQREQTYEYSPVHLPCDSTPKLTVNCGEYEFTNFDKAVAILAEEYGYQGEAWDMVVASDDLEILAEFLNDDGLDAEYEE
jgi:hypothetical protein